MRTGIEGIVALKIENLMIDDGFRLGSTSDTRVGPL